MKKSINCILAVVLSSTFTLSFAQSKKDTAKTKEKEIEEVVVVGFGKQKKVNLTGSISSVSEKAIEGRPVNNVVEALQGTAAGLNFNLGAGGGQLNNTKSFNIRGTGSIGGNSSSPLVLIDGMEGDLTTLNPRDVESISVLKDAAASSIYGSRAPFGVILVTTKQGKKGRTTVSYDLMTRFSSPLLLPKMLNSEDFAYYFNEAAKNSGQSQVFSDETLQKIKDYRAGKLNYATEWKAASNDWKQYTESFADVDWFQQFYRKWVPSTEHNLAVRGGAEKIQYYFSANWLGQEGLMRYNQDQQDRYSINGKISAEILPSLKLDYNTRFTRTDYQGSAYMDGLFFHNIARRWPTLPVTDPNGNYLYGNEIPQLEGSLRKNQSDVLTQQLALIFEPIKGWETRAEFNYKTENNFIHTQYLPIYKYDPNGNITPAPYNTGWGLIDKAGGSVIQEYAWKQNFFNTNIYTTYHKSLESGHDFKIMVGMQSELNKDRSLQASRDMLYSIGVPTINTTYGTNDDVSGGYGHWATFGVFGRLNYNYKQKYLLEVNTRYDGTSRFLKGQRWNWFPSVSLGWNVANEGFWQKLGGFGEKVREFKFRASYGSLGNQNTSSLGWYPFFQSMNVGVNNGYWLIGGLPTNTASIPNIISAFLTWERVTTWNYGFDLSAFSNRLTVNFDIFKRKTYDMVAPGIELPATLGASVPSYNNSDMVSNGFELQIGWRGKIGSDFTYNLNGVLSDARQKITRYNNDIGDLNKYYVGRYLGEIWGYTSRGIAKSDAEMAEWLKTHDQSRLGANWAAGDIMYEDLNGDGKIDTGANTLADHGDISIIGNSTPRYNFGLNVSMAYKGFDLGFFFQGTGKRDINVASQPYFLGANTNMWQSAGFEEHLDYFRPENTTNPLGPNLDSYYTRPLFDQGGKNYYTQTRWLQNGAYVRLKNLQFGYSLPQEMLNKIGVNKLRIYISAENVFTITKMSKIFDPETIDGSWGGGKLYPLSRVISTGISLTF
ncbi:SusC/RagA family TonB-linked outer membrane protein [Elizabethkingia sp. JS20170427COW]|uniref:SusC/RagA family TonB-linked outer membrane protein n=1 Tax=Elizabethkingia sp. JS20170427COW TaxID=2583851 RepID=UPI00111030D6|nr:SusC/RagA family TonB-linked outer membrane protein [Elizabethkingia sp. JS20170427COW]QCX54262.1 SusC/RagA family TonB-linked outer membrane protein [Elizabethkingia sp. JS20170427COW]